MKEINRNKMVTVVIPTYKRGVKYLSRAVESVKKQTYDNIEIIVIDDSPNDYEDREAVGQYMETVTTDRIHYFKNETNLGGSLARNKGILLAKGEYITFLDDDDEYMPMKIEKQIAFMEETGCDLSFADMVMYNNSGKVVDYREYKDICAFDNDSLLRYHLMKHMTGTPTFMFKTDKLKEIGGFDDVKMGQEFHLMLKAIERGLEIRYFPECDVKVYKHEDGGISQGRNKIDGEIRLYEFKKKYFHLLAKEEVKYIDFRHWVVMAIAYKRNKMYFSMVYAFIKGFVSSPKNFFEQFFIFVNKIRKVRK